MGVVLNNQVYLFDPRLGLPIPSTTDLSQSNKTPATLNQISEHPEWLQQLALRADQPYVIEAASLKQTRLFPLSEVVYWESRMKLLEETLPASDLCVLYDPLMDDSGRTGLLTRLSTAIPGRSADQFQPWPYFWREPPVITDAMRLSFEMQMRAFDLPVPVIRTEATNELKRLNPERKMLKIRTDQLLGHFEEATQRYFSIRHLEIDRDQLQFKDLAVLNQIAAEDAIYWSAVCKFEAGKPSAAIEQLEGYLRRFDRTGRWNFAARVLLGDSHAELGKFDAAAKRPGKFQSFR